MAEQKYTPEVVNKALEPEERLQYRSLVNLLLEGKVLNVQQQAKYDGYKEKIDMHIKQQENPDGGGSSKEPPNAVGIGIPENLRVKRRYTMSPGALEQRRKATHSPNKAAGMEGNRNGWKHGHFAQNFISKMKPCKSTCPQYPCSLVENGDTEPGDDCLDKADVLMFFRAVNDAIVNKKLDSFNDLASLQISNTMKVIEMLIEDIMRDGSVVKREKFSSQGDLIVEYVTHPSLQALPKLLADLGLNPAEFLITPRAKKRADSDDEMSNTLAEMMSRAGKVFRKKLPTEDEE